MSLWKDLHSRESNFFKMAPGCSPAWKFPEIEILNFELILAIISHNYLILYLWQ